MPNDKHTTWILISDASRARLFAAESGQASLILVQAFEHPESRAANHDLVTDRPGRTQQSAAAGRLGPAAGPTKGGNRSAMEAPMSPKEREHEEFAQELAAALYKGMATNAYVHLVLAAPPHFLGLLREELDESVRKRVTTSLHKDYTHLPLPELAERLNEAIAEAS